MHSGSGQDPGHYYNFIDLLKEITKSSGSSFSNVQGFWFLKQNTSGCFWKVG